MIITIDGKAGTGKSTVARKFARTLDFFYFDTGALYRAVTFSALSKGISLDDQDQIVSMIQSLSFHVVSTSTKETYFLGEREITEEIRLPEVTAAVSQVAALPKLREALKPIQRKYGEKGNILFDGRDLGTVIFPYADIKFFFTAKEEIRAERRFLELSKRFPHRVGEMSYKQTLIEIKERDLLDSTRMAAPLLQPDDAIVIDTSYLTLDQVVEKMKKVYLKKKRGRFFRGSLLYRSVIFLVTCFFKCFYRYRVFGLSHYPEGGALLAATHSSFYDPPSVAIGCPEAIHFLARSTLFRSWFGKLIQKINAHPIDRKHRAFSGVKMVSDLVKKGGKVLIFPEGTRSDDGKIGKIEPGIGFLFYKCRIPLVPVYIRGTHSVWKREKRFPKLWGKIMVVFGSPIYWKEELQKDRDRTIDWVRLELKNRLLALEEWVDAGAVGDPP